MQDTLIHTVERERAGRAGDTAALSRAMQRRLRWRLRRRAGRTMASTELELDCKLTVHEIVNRYPATREVFTRFGMDTCCGSSVSVEESAHREGADPAEVCEALRTAVQN